MLVAILILCACAFAIWLSFEESDGFIAFIGLFIAGVLGFFLFMITGLFYYPNQHESTQKLEKLSSGSYVQVANDTYTFKIDDKIIVKDKSDLDITILGENGTPKAHITKDKGGFNHIGYEFEVEEYELKIPSGAVEKIK